MPFSPLTLTLSPKGRGDITFDNTEGPKGEVYDQRKISRKYSYLWGSS
jgi:hypothetical protein